MQAGHEDEAKEKVLLQYDDENDSFLVGTKCATRRWAGSNQIHMVRDNDASSTASGTIIQPFFEGSPLYVVVPTVGPWTTASTNQKNFLCQEKRAFWRNRY